MVDVTIARLDSLENDGWGQVAAALFADRWLTNHCLSLTPFVDVLLTNHCLSLTFC